MRVVGLLLTSSIVAISIALFTQAVDAQTAPSITVTSPQANELLEPGTVIVEFETQNFTLGNEGEDHMHFYVDDDNAPYATAEEIWDYANMFYAGPDRNADNGVLLRGDHTHAVHWESNNSFKLFGMAPGEHTITFVLADANHGELTDTLYTFTFTVKEPEPSELKLEQMLGGLTFPVALAYDKTGNQLFYNEFITGNVRVADTSDPNNWVLQETPVYTFDIQLGVEQGLYGIALDPDFDTNGYLYVMYTAKNPLRNIVSRITVSNGVGTDETIIYDPLPTSDIHNGGNIHFGNDGKLYVSVGDAESPETAQDPSSPNGAILRLNADGTVPTDNPITGSPVYAYGLRSPFDFTFYPGSDTILNTENGEDEDDEINVILPAGNYGWPNVQGECNTPEEITFCNANAVIEPILTFTPTISPVGIVVIPPTSPYPTDYHYNVLFSDYNIGRIHRVKLDPSDLTTLASHKVSYRGREGSLLDIEIGPQDYAYITSESGIYKILLVDEPPTPTVPIETPTPTPGTCGAPGDIDCSGEVNLLDLSALLAAYGSDDPDADLDGSGEVNLIDLSILLANYGSLGTTPTPTFTPTPTPTPLNQPTSYETPIPLQ